MKKLTVLLLVLVLALATFGNISLASKPVEPDYYLHMDQTAVSYGDNVSFTALYPKRATRSVTTQQHNNPIVQIDCYNPITKLWMWRASIIFIDETRNNDGSIYGISSSTHLGGSGWASGSANCSAILFYVADKDITIVVIDHISFYVNE